MEHVIVRLANPAEIEEMRSWLARSDDVRFFDPDVLAHDSTFVLMAFGTKSGRMAYLPVQQPFMLENFIVRPGLGESLRPLALTRLVECAIGEAFRRDAGELYFLSGDRRTLSFAARHKFCELPDRLKARRLNLRETFGV